MSASLGTCATLARRMVTRCAAPAMLGAVLLAYGTLDAWRDRHVLLVNRTGSLPNWAFLVDRDRVPRRGEYVFFVPPRSVLLIRHFGRDPNPFGKIVYGVAGDMVARRGRQFLVNGRPVALAKLRTLRGEPLAVGPTGRVPPGCFFVGTPNRDSFDSRYALIGWVCRPQLVGTGEPVL